MDFGGQWQSIILLVALVVIMYVAVFLPAKKREKKAREMLESLKVGFKITTIGGIYGEIINIQDEDLTISTSIDNTKLLIKKWAVKEYHEEISDDVANN